MYKVNIVIGPCYERMWEFRVYWAVFILTSATTYSSRLSLFGQRSMFLGAIWSGLVVADWLTHEHQSSAISECFFLSVTTLERRIASRDVDASEAAGCGWRWRLIGDVGVRPRHWQRWRLPAGRRLLMRQDVNDEHPPSSSCSSRQINTALTRWSAQDRTRINSDHHRSLSVCLSVSTYTPDWTAARNSLAGHWRLCSGEFKAKVYLLACMTKHTIHRLTVIF